MTPKEKQAAIEAMMLVADDYEIGINKPDNEMRIIFKDDMGETLSEFICLAEDGYEFATKILHAYDELEGI